MVSVMKLLDIVKANTDTVFLCRKGNLYDSHIFLYEWGRLKLLFSSINSCNNVILFIKKVIINRKIG